MMSLLAEAFLVSLFCFALLSFENKQVKFQVPESAGALDAENKK